MKTRFIVAINVKGAGPSMIVNELITNLLEDKTRNSLAGFNIFLADTPAFEHLKKLDTGNIKIHFSHKGKFSFGYRLYEYLKISLTSYILNAKASFVFGNFFPFPLNGKKHILLHHPYIVDDSLFNPLRGLKRLQEDARRSLFKITLLTTDKVFVQSEYMLNRYKIKFASFTCETDILFNPLSSKQQKRGGKVAKRNDQTSNDILYVSRFAPHKNHPFLLSIALTRGDEMRQKNIRFITTVDSSLPGASDFLEKIEQSKLSDLIVNIGEVEQSELNDHYRHSIALFFPSISETFGNPLIEAMHFGLPVIVPNLSYAHSVCGKAGMYYEPKDPDDAWSLIVGLFDEKSTLERQKALSLKQVQKYPSSKEWTERIIEECGQYNKTTAI